MTNQPIRVLTLDQRKDQISQIQPSGNTFPVTFRGRQKHLATKKVPRNTLSYRIANIRTMVKQTEHLQANPGNPELFEDGQ